MFFRQISFNIGLHPHDQAEFLVLKNAIPAGGEADV